MTLIIEQNNTDTKFTVVSQDNLPQIDDDPNQGSQQSSTYTRYNVDSRIILQNDLFSNEESTSYYENVDVNSSLSLASSLINAVDSGTIVTNVGNHSPTSHIFGIFPTIDISPVDIDLIGNQSTGVIYNPELNAFETKNIERLIKSSQESTGKISILSHEKLTILKSSDRLDTNLLYLSSESIDSEKFKSINNSKYNKFESISDRLFNYINIENYESLLKTSLNKSLNYISLLDDISTFAKKLEKDINYGNIVENFIKDGITKYNSRILGLLTENDDVYIDSVASSDERLLVKQKTNLSTNISTSDLANYYNNVLGFSLIEENPNFTNSIKNSIIKNTDTVVGQIMLMQGLSLFSLHPNDAVFSPAYLNSRRKINLNAFNKFPILQLTDFNSDIFEKNQEILSIQNNIFSTKIKYKSELLPISPISDKIGKYIDKNNDDTLTFKNRNSILGFVAKSVASTVVNNVTITEFVEKINNKQIRLMVTDGSQDGEEIFDLLVSDAYSYHPDISPKFLMLPTRYFSSTAFDNINQAVHDTNLRARDADAQIPRRGDVFHFNSFLGKRLESSEAIRSSEIQNRILEVFFRNFNGPVLSSTPSTALNFGAASNLYINYLGPQLSKMYYNAIYDDVEHLNCDNKIKLLYTFSGESDEARNFYNASLDEYFIKENSFQSYYTDNSNGRNRVEIEQVFDDYITKVLAKTDESIESIEFNNSEVSSNIRNSLTSYDLNNRLNDIVLFNTSNSFLNFDELYKYSLEYNREGLLSENNSLKYIKYNREKINNIRGKDVTSRHSSYASVLYNKNSYIFASKLLDNISSAISKTRFVLGGDVVEKYSDFISKAKSKVVDGNKYILLYDKDKVNALETFKESSFISDNSFYKNNFVDSFSDIKNTSSAFFEEASFGDHFLTSEEYRKFLSNIYTKSFLRNRKSLIKKVLKDNIRIFKQYSYDNSIFLGFDKLMADVFLNEKVKPAIKRKLTNIIAVNSILNIRKINDEIGSLRKKPVLVDMFHKDSRSDENFMFSKEFKKLFSKELVDEVVRGIFEPHVIKEQRNFVIRSIQSKISNVDSLNFTSSGGIGGVNFKIIPGMLHTMKFPLYETTHELPKNIGISHIDICTSQGVIDVNMTKRMRKLIKYISYNHDIFIDEENSGISYYENVNLSEENNFHGCAGYDFVGDKTAYGTDLKITYFDYDSRMVNAQIETMEPPYNRYGVVIPFSYFYNSCIQNTFSYYITNLAKNIFEIFKCDLSGVNTIQDALDFLELNKQYVSILQDIFECYAYVFSTSYDNLINNTVHHKCKNAIDDDLYDGAVAGGVGQFFEKSVSDIEIVVDRMLVDFEYKRENVYSENDYLQSSENDMFTSRSNVLQKVCSTLVNSDLSESIGHDILHGFFSNYEDNKNNKEDNLKSYNDSVSKIKEGISLLDVDEDIINNYILDEAYQNKVSKGIQEVIYYKNLYKETFINNTMYLNLEEKYKINNKFNHRKAHEELSYNHSIECLQQITHPLSEDRTNKLDVIRIPITFDLVKKLTTKGILKVTILPLNIKYPEVEYQELSYFYSPMLANLTPQYASIVDNTSNFIGIYNDTQKISERYCVVDKDTAANEINIVLTDIFNFKQAIAQQDSISDILALSSIIVNQNKLSHNIGQLSYISQNAISENILAFDKDTNNLISPEAIQLFQNISEDSLVKSFGLESIDISALVGQGSYQNLGSNKDILKNRDLYKKYMLNLDKDISEVDLLKSLLPTKNYDIFNILININDLVPAEENDITNYRGVSNVNDIGRNNVLHAAANGNDSIETFNATKSFLYYIKIGVL